MLVYGANQRHNCLDNSSVTLTLALNLTLILTLTLIVQPDDLEERTQRVHHQCYAASSHTTVILQDCKTEVRVGVMVRVREVPT